MCIVDVFYINNTYSNAKAGPILAMARHCKEPGAITMTINLQSYKCIAITKSTRLNNYNISFDLALRESHLLTFLNSFIVVSRAFASDLLIFLGGCPPPGKAPQRHGGLPSSGKSTYNSPSMEDNPLILDNILLSSPNRS